MERISPPPAFVVAAVADKVTSADAEDAVRTTGDVARVWAFTLAIVVVIASCVAVYLDAVSP